MAGVDRIEIARPAVVVVQCFPALQTCRISDAPSVMLMCMAAVCCHQSWHVCGDTLDSVQSSPLVAQRCPCLIAWRLSVSLEPRLASMQLEWRSVGRTFKNGSCS